MFLSQWSRGKNRFVLVSIEWGGTKNPIPTISQRNFANEDTLSPQFLFRDLSTGRSKLPQPEDRGQFMCQLQSGFCSRLFKYCMKKPVCRPSTLQKTHSQVVYALKFKENGVLFIINTTFTNKLMALEKQKVLSRAVRICLPPSLSPEQRGHKHRGIWNFVQGHTNSDLKKPCTPAFSFIFRFPECWHTGKSSMFSTEMFRLKSHSTGLQSLRPSERPIYFPSFTESIYPGLMPYSRKAF